MNEFVQHAHNSIIELQCYMEYICESDELRGSLETLKCKQIADVIFKTLQNPGIHFHQQKSRFDILH